MSTEFSANTRPSALREPVWSTWGPVQHCRELDHGIWRVDTERHGGIVVDPNVAKTRISPAAYREGFADSGYHNYEEHEQWSVLAYDIPEVLAGKAMSNHGKYRSPGLLEELVKEDLVRFHTKYQEAVREDVATPEGSRTTRLAQGVLIVRSEGAAGVWVSPARASQMSAQGQQEGVLENGGWRSYKVMASNDGPDRSCIPLIELDRSILRGYAALLLAQEATKTNQLPSGRVFDSTADGFSNYAQGQVAKILQREPRGHEY